MWTEGCPYYALHICSFFVHQRSETPSSIASSIWKRRSATFFPRGVSEKLLLLCSFGSFIEDTRPSFSSSSAFFKSTLLDACIHDKRIVYVGKNSNCRCRVFISSQSIHLLRFSGGFLQGSLIKSRMSILILSPIVLPAVVTIFPDLELEEDWLMKNHMS